MSRGARRGWLWLLALVVAVTGVSVVLAHARGTSPPVRGPAPAFTLPDLSGRPVSLATFAGQDVALRFGSVTCTVCNDDWDTLARWQQDAAPGLRIVAVESGQPAALVRLRMQGVQPAVPVLVDAAAAVAAAYGVTSLPAFAFVDRAGDLVAVQAVLNRGAIWPDATWQYYLGLLHSADAQAGR